jgi:mannose-1-phosphate guanylyltransferase
VSGAAEFEIWPVLLAGGIGSRFWPASTPSRPKQFLPLLSDRPLIRETFERAADLAPAGRTLVVSSADLEELFDRHLPELPRANLLLEPHGRGTAAALGWAAREIGARAADPSRAVMVSLHSDHFIRPAESFTATVRRAVEGAGRTGRLVTLGVPPSRPETGYGYIEVGRELTTGLREVRRFVEKPDRDRAESFVRRGGFLWNSGIFVWRPDVLRREIDAHTPEMAEALERLDAGDVAGFYARTPPLTIDRGLLERSSNIAVVAAEFEWDDVGAWSSLLRTRPRDPAGNVGFGHAYLLECRDSVVWAEDGPVVTFALDGIVVARASGITFVAPLERAAELKDVLGRLPERLLRGEA